MESFEELVRRVQAADVSPTERHAAFAGLVVGFQDLAYGYAFALLGDPGLAEDVAQEAFLTAYQELDQLRDPRAFPGWLRRIVLTQCHRLIRQKRRSTTLLDTISGLPSATPDPLAIVEQRELRATVRAAILALPARDRAVIALFYLSCYSLQEIASFLGIPVTTVKKRLQYARERLKRTMLLAVHDRLRDHRPSRDGQFVRRVRFALVAPAFAAEDQRRVEDLLLVDGAGDEGITLADPLALRSWVVQAGCLVFFELLLVDGWDVDAPDEDGYRPLTWAVHAGSLDTVMLLLRHHADVAAPDRSGRTPLQSAIESDQDAIVTAMKTSC